MARIEVFTDGACRGNPGPGAWAAIVRVTDAPERELSGFEAATTNNRMELSAAIEGLAATPPGSVIRLSTDSRYVVDGMTQWVAGWIRRGWRKADRSPVLNQELWQRLVAEAGKRKVEWAWVEGHAGHPENERCDVLANLEIDRHRR
ncbi:MAG: ribonuclease HI [Planctomycetota bacterium]